MLFKLLRAGRPHFLVIGLALFIFGVAWAALSGASLSLPRLMLGALVILLAQLSVSYSNEYFDQAVDQPGSATSFSGGSGVLAVNPDLRKAVLRIALVLMAGSLLSGAVFLWIYSYPLWMMAFVILGNLAGWYYSAPPLRLSARGLGEICYILILGFLVPAMGYLTLQGRLDSTGALVLPPLCLYSLASILDVELPDLEVDLAGGKKTWVVRWGRRFGFRAIGLLLLASTGYFFLFPRFYGGQLPLDFRSLGLLSLIPLGAGLVGFVNHPLERGPATRISTWIILSLVIFVLIVDAYLIYLSTR
ncbi:MAG: prenyltransferase [Anaerolineaceae bacterium]